MVKYPKVSIIIPLYVICERFFSDFLNFQEIKYPNFEILVVSDVKVDLPKLEGIEVKSILTGERKTSPAEKRDLSLKYIKGEICAFIDDDAYPDIDWLKAVRWFRNQDIVAVGGPGITPPSDSFWGKIGGNIIESFFCSGGVQHRFYPGKSSESLVKDWPAYNLFVRSKILKKVGGYGSTFYGGEDTLLCMKLIKLGKILYDPKAIVYHHRRNFPWAHLKQISGVGLHRGYFFKTQPETSRMLFYLLPTILTISFILGLLISIYNPSLFLLPFISLFFVFWFLGSWSIFRHNVSLIQASIGGLGIILTHIFYGIFFIKGLFTKKLLI